MRQKEDLEEEAKVIMPFNERSLRTLASGIYQTLRDEGCQEKDIIGVSSQLISLATQALDQSDKS